MQFREGGPGMIKLDIGSGALPAEGYTTLDRNPRHRPNVVAQIPPLPFTSGSVQTIRAYHVIEHIQDMISLMDECWRVLEPGGDMKITAPYAFSGAAFQDPTHVRFIVPNTWLYFTHHFDYLDYAIKARFEIINNGVYDARKDEPEVWTLLKKCGCEICKEGAKC